MRGRASCTAGWSSVCRRSASLFLVCFRPFLKLRSVLALEASLPDLIRQSMRTRSAIKLTDHVSQAAAQYGPPDQVRWQRKETIARAMKASNATKQLIE